MKRVLFVLAAVVALMILAAPAIADWDPIGDDTTGEIINHKMHWPQLPDLQTGLNVRATSQFGMDQGTIAGKVLADDFLCTETGPITGIHIWGSWLNDLLPHVTVDDPTGGTTGQIGEDPGAVAFRLSLHKNVPAYPDEPDSFSHPEPEFWHEWFFPNEFKVRELPEPATEGFFDPNQNEIIGTDSRVFQYNFYPKDPQVQQRDEIYWLDVTAVPLAPGPAGTQEEVLFGWKSTHPELHFEDDAVFGHMIVAADGSIVPMNDWQPLKYPPDWEYAGTTMDLAFVITPEPGTVAMLIGAGLMGLTVCVRRWRKR